MGTTIGVIVNSLTKGLKSAAVGIGNDLQTLGKKIAQILPGLIGTIVSFIFKTAGSVISFLGKNAWLLILGVKIRLIVKYTWNLKKALIWGGSARPLSNIFRDLPHPWVAQKTAKFNR